MKKISKFLMVSGIVGLLSMFSCSTDDIENQNSIDNELPTEDLRLRRSSESSIS